MALKFMALMVLACGASLLLTPIVRGVALRLGAVDKPGGRKIHLVPVPQFGGISIVLSVLLVVLSAGWFEPLNDMFSFEGRSIPALLWGSSLIFLVGIYDDLRPIPAWGKFLAQSVAAGIAIWCGVRIELISTLGTGAIDAGILAVPLTFLWIVGLTNAFNLIDGLDGLATGLGIIAAITSATIFFMGGNVSDGLFLLVLAGALIGFLRYNFHPASIFLGDSGSQFIGYVLAVTAVTGSQKGATALPVIIPLLVFELPILDTFLSMLRRALKREEGSRPPRTSMEIWIESAKRMFEADRDHVHHRLITMGLSHRAAVLTLYALAAGLSLLALVAVAAHYRNAGAILLTVIVATYIGVGKLGYEGVAFLKTGTLLRWGERVRCTRLSSLALLDVFLIATAYWAAFVLKYDGAWTEATLQWYLIAFPFALIVQVSVFWSLGLYRGVWRAMGAGDLLSLGFAIGIAVLLCYVLAMVYEPPAGIRAFWGINWILLEILIVSGRAAGKILVHLRRRSDETEGTRVIVYGAGRRGEWILRELNENRRLAFQPIGFLDDDARLTGRTINRVRVLGSSHDLASILNSHRVSALIVSSGKIPAERLRYVTTLCSDRQILVLRSQLQLECLSLNVEAARDTLEQGELMAFASHPTHTPEPSLAEKIGTL